MGNLILSLHVTVLWRNFLFLRGRMQVASLARNKNILYFCCIETGGLIDVIWLTFCSPKRLPMGGIPARMVVLWKGDEVQPLRAVLKKNGVCFSEADFEHFLVVFGGGGL